MLLSEHMITLSTDKQNVTLCAPNPDRDAPFALQWFDSPYGKDTLLLMGNAENEIQPSTLESERKTIQEFLDLEAVHKQYTWMIRHEDQTIGAVWLELVDIPELKSPRSTHNDWQQSLQGAGDRRSSYRESTYLCCKRAQLHRHLLTPLS